MRFPIFILSFLSLAIMGCAATRPASQGVIVDTKGVDMVAYQTDLTECNAYADEVEIGRQAAEGAVEGAVVGAAVGAVIGGHEGAERIGAAGSIGGGARGARSAVNERDMVMRRCLTGRGYRVLN